MVELVSDKSIKDSEKKYFDYLTVHKSGVERTWTEILRPQIEVFLSEDELLEIDKIIEEHDTSKYSEEEFDAYRKWFYPVTENEKDSDAFDLAWLHHQHSNPHHPQYWILKRDSGEEVILDMDLKYVIEMLCDWHSFTLKDPASTAYSWYQEKKDILPISTGTREVVEKYIGYLKEPLTPSLISEGVEEEDKSYWYLNGSLDYDGTALWLDCKGQYRKGHYLQYGVRMTASEAEKSLKILNSRLPRPAKMSSYHEGS